MSRFLGRPPWDLLAVETVKGVLCLRCNIKEFVLQFNSTSISPHDSGTMGRGSFPHRDSASKQCQRTLQTNSGLPRSHILSTILDAPLEAFSSGKTMDLDLLKAFLMACHLANLLSLPSMFPMGPPSQITSFFTMHECFAFLK